MIHDRDTIYSEGVERTLEAMGLAVLKTPARVPQANAFRERLIGTIRRECLDFVNSSIEHCAKKMFVTLCAGPVCGATSSVPASCCALARSFSDSILFQNRTLTMVPSGPTSIASIAVVTSHGNSLIRRMRFVIGS